MVQRPTAPLWTRRELEFTVNSSRAQACRLVAQSLPSTDLLLLKLVSQSCSDQSIEYWANAHQSVMDVK